jgi:hypothetical protein
MGTQRVQMKGVLSWLVRLAFRAGTRDFCSALAALVGPVQNILFLTVHYFNNIIKKNRKQLPAKILSDSRNRVYP